MLSRINTKQLKGLAVLLMLAHHLFTFPDRWPSGFEFNNNVIINNTLINIIGNFGKICVPIFMFLGGYGLYASCVYYENNEIKIKNVFINKVVNLYKCYWKVFLIFVPIGILFFSNQPTFLNSNYGNSFSNTGFHKVIATFFGLENNFNYEWWFFKHYLFALFEGFVFIELFKKNKSVYFEIVFIILWYILITGLLPNLISLGNLQSLAGNFWYNSFFGITPYSVLFFVGILFSKYDIFKYWNDIIVNLSIIEKIVLSLVTLSLCVYVRYGISSLDLDVLLVPFVCFSMLVLMNCISLLGKIFLFIGKNSTNMWLTHSFYCYYFYPFVRMVYYSKNAVISYLTLVILSLLTSILIDLLWKYIFKLYHKVHIFLLNKGY